MEQIYILSAVNLHKNSQQDIQRKFRIHNLKYHRNDNFKKYLQWLADMQKLRYRVETYDTAYFTEKETAENYARQNMADINEAGSYPYLVIYSRPIDTMYAEAYDSDVTIFRFNESEGVYQVMEKHCDEWYVIANQFDIRYQHDEHCIETANMYSQMPID